VNDETMVLCSDDSGYNAEYAMVIYDFQQCGCPMLYTGTGRGHEEERSNNDLGG